MDVSITDEGRVLMRDKNFFRYMDDPANKYFPDSKKNILLGSDLVQFSKGFAVSFLSDEKYQTHIVDFNLKKVEILLNSKAIFENKGDLVYANFTFMKKDAFISKMKDSIFCCRIHRS